MFGLFSKKKKPKNALDEFIFAIYGNPPPVKRANVGHAVELASDLLAGVIDEKEVSRQAVALNDGPIPYSTHDLALSIALNFFKQPGNTPHLYEAQILARMKMLEWLDKGLVAPMLVQSFESVLYKIYKIHSQESIDIQNRNLTMHSNEVSLAPESTIMEDGEKSQRRSRLYFEALDIIADRIDELNPKENFKNIKSYLPEDSVIDKFEGMHDLSQHDLALMLVDAGYKKNEDMMSKENISAAYDAIRQTGAILTEDLIKTMDYCLAESLKFHDELLTAVYEAALLNDSKIIPQFGSVGRGMHETIPQRYRKNL